jgi:hypothetical protein
MVERGKLWPHEVENLQIRLRKQELIMPLLEPIDKEIPLPGGGKKVFILSKFPAIAGREIVTQYPMSAAPKVGDYSTNEDLMLKLMRHVGVHIEGRPEPLILENRALVDNHVPDFETLLKIEWEMMRYNCSFFQNGKASSFLELLMEKLQALATQTLTDFSQQLSTKSKQSSKN